MWRTVRLLRNFYWHIWTPTRGTVLQISGFKRAFSAKVRLWNSGVETGVQTRFRLKFQNIVGVSNEGFKSVLFAVYCFCLSHLESNASPPQGHFCSQRMSVFNWQMVDIRRRRGGGPASCFSFSHTPTPVEHKDETVMIIHALSSAFTHSWRIFLQCTLSRHAHSITPQHSLLHQLYCKCTDGGHVTAAWCTLRWGKNKTG